MITSWINTFAVATLTERPNWKKLVKAVAASYGDQFSAIAETLKISNEPVKSVPKDEPKSKPYSMSSVQPSVINATGGSQLLSSYNFNSHTKEDGKTPHGLALLIQCDTFWDSNGPRDDMRLHCVPCDTELLRNTLTQLGYRVVVRRNLRGNDIYNVFKNIQNNSDGDLHIKSEDDSFICVIGSHGYHDGVHGSDLEKFSFKNIRDLLGATKCKCLHGKPKLFFVQACRGDPIESIAGAKRMSVQPEAHRLPQESDFFFSYSTAFYRYTYCPVPLPGCPCQPGYYVKALCEALKSYGTKLDLIHIVLTLHQRLHGSPNYLIPLIDENRETHMTRQCPELVTSLRGPVFFFDSAREKYRHIFD